MMDPTPGHVLLAIFVLVPGLYCLLSKAQERIR